MMLEIVSGIGSGRARDGRPTGFCFGCFGCFGLLRLCFVDMLNPHFRHTMRGPLTPHLPFLSFTTSEIAQ